MGSILLRWVATRRWTTANPDQLLDGVWTVEPWVSLLESEANGKVLVEEPEAITTLLVARRGFLDTQRELVRKFVIAHEELTDWIIKNPEEGQRLAWTSRCLPGITSAVLLSLAWFDNAVALPVAQIPATVGTPEIILVAGGYGPGWHRDWAGRCRPNGGAVVVAPAPPVVVAPVVGAPVVCGPGFRWHPRFRRCVVL